MTREEAIECIQEEKLRYERAPLVNGCPMTEEWQKAIDICDMAISALRARQEQESKPLNGWISVKDRLPDNKEHDWVLAQVVEDNGYMHIPRVMEDRQAKDDWFEETYGWLSEHNGLFSVTHWMPLPPPPKGE